MNELLIAIQTYVAACNLEHSGHTDCHLSASIPVGGRALDDTDYQISYYNCLLEAAKQDKSCQEAKQRLVRIAKGKK